MFCSSKLSPFCQLRMSSDWTKMTGMMILIFWIIVPTFDQYSDILMVTRLFRGPDPNLYVEGGLVKEHKHYTIYVM